MILDGMGAIHADTRNSAEAIHADIGAVYADIGAAHADTRNSIGALYMWCRT